MVICLERFISPRSRLPLPRLRLDQFCGINPHRDDFFILINGVHISFKAVLIIPIFAELLLIASGLAFFLGALFVNFRDLSPIWEVVLQAGFYATPIIYPASLVATNIGPQAARFV